MSIALAPQTETRTSTWEIDPAHTLVEFSVKHMMVATVKGRFAGVTGRIVSVLRLINRWLHFVAGLLLLVIMLMTVVDVIGRTAFNSPFRGTVELTQMAMVVVEKLEGEGIEVTTLEGEELERWLAAGDEVAQSWIEAREAEGAPAQEMFEQLQELAGG